MADVKICDRCKAIFPDKNTWIEVHPDRHILSFITRKIHYWDDMEFTCIDKRIDLCPECIKELNKFLNGKATDAVSVLPKYDPEAEMKGPTYDG